jgi:hypothetical protein
VVVFFVVPLLLIVFSCHEVIKMPQQSSKAGVDTGNRCFHCPKLGVGGMLCGLQLANLLICHLHISIKSLHVRLHLMYQSLNDMLHGRRLWWHVLDIVHWTCHGKVHKKTRKKISEEEQKGLALLGCSCCKALTLNLLTQALTSSYIASQDGEGNQQVSNHKDGVSVLA